MGITVNDRAAGSMEPYTVRRLAPEDMPKALFLVWKVFCQFEAPEYTEEGVEEFRKTLDDEQKISRMNFYGAFAGPEIAGVLAMRKPQHISLFFVKEEYQQKGIGRQLFEAMCRDYERQEFTVNSSPFAVNIYKHLGFVPTDTEQVTHGIRYTPMVFNRRGNMR